VIYRSDSVLFQYPSGFIYETGKIIEAELVSQTNRTAQRCCFDQRVLTSQVDQRPGVFTARSIASVVPGKRLKSECFVTCRLKHVREYRTRRVRQFRHKTGIMTIYTFN
jgi:hypothetical protein